MTVKTAKAKSRKVAAVDHSQVFQIEATFPISGSGVLRRDHSYQLFGAISHNVPEMHSRRDNVAVFPISGLPADKTTMTLWDRSRLRLRLKPDAMQEFIKLGGKTLAVDGARFQVGAPQIHFLKPYHSLQAKVLLNDVVDPGDVLTVCVDRLRDLGISGIVRFRDPNVVDGRHQSHRVVRIKDVALSCYWIVVAGLTDHDSMTLQYVGLGNKRHFGCGVFTHYTR